jgi:hypothetical protein
LVKGEGRYEGFLKSSFTVMYDREGANGLRELPRDWKVESSIPAEDAFDTKTDQELFKGWWIESCQDKFKYFIISM